MKQILLHLIRLYQKISIFNNPLSRMLFLSESVCRFVPRCSDYTYTAVEKYGVASGLWLGLKRIVRCNPWDKGGFDPVQ